jgi:hypothetical protein
MEIDWRAVATIAAPIIALFVGVWVNRRFESRPHLISYFSHVSAFRTTPPESDPVFVNTHSVVIRNAGRRRATNVRLRHTVLPDFNVWPAVQHYVEDLPGGFREIVFPIIVPSEEITISYLYFAPLTYAQVNAGIKSDEGLAHQIPVLLQRQYGKLFNATVAILMLIGLISVIYVTALGILHLLW